MNRALNRVIFSIVFALLSLSASYSQSLYWIGGTGEFNDPKHWSKTSGGVSAFMVPNNTTDVYFDDNSAEGRYTVNFAKNSSVKSFNATSTTNNVSFEGSKQDVVYISEGIYLSYTVKFNSEAEMIFNSASLSTNLIEFGLSKLKCNLYFNHGNYTFRPIVMEEQNSINFGDGKYTFYKSAVSTGNFISASPKAIFDIDQTVIKASNLFRIDENSTVNSNKLYLSANKSSAQKFKAPQAMLNQPSNTFVNFAPICSLTITTVPSCNGPCTGVMTISFSPGCVDNPYSVSASNGDASCAATTASLSGVFNTATASVVSFSNACVCSQNYLILILDNLGNPFIQNVNFNVNTATASNSNTLASCSYLCDGKMSGNIFGSFPYTVAVTPNTVTPANFTTAIQYTLNNLCPGQVYTLTVTDKDGCVANITKTMGITPPISANSVTQNVLCNASCNGSISVNPTGGSPGYTVAFSSTLTPSPVTVAAAGTASVVNVCPGVYTSTITDAKGCTLTTNYNITQPPPMTVTPTQTNLVCNAVCNGVAQVSVSGGASPYFYVWSPSASTASNATNLCAGTQTVSILDNNACPASHVFTITSPPAITVTVAKKDVVCNAQCNGSATVTMAGGVAPYTFTWSPAATPSVVNSPSTTATGLCPNIYTVLARDNNLCTNTVNITITEPPALTLTVSKTDNTCFSSCAGSASAVISGGNGAPYTFAWTSATVTGAATGTASGMCAGSYTVAVTDASACPISSVITITQPTSITPNITTASLSCNAVCIGSINAAPVGGSGGPYTFTLFTPIPSTIVGPPPYTNLCAGIYTLAISDVSNCVSSTTINIQQPPALIPSVSGSSITCFNACNGSLAGSVLGGTPGYTLSWTTPTSTIPGGNLINQCAGNYTFNVLDSKGCTAQATFTLLQPADITATFNVTNPTCNTSNNGAIGVILAGGTPGYTLNWSSGSGNPNVNLPGGTYTLTVTDANNCIKIFTVAVVPPPAFTVAIVTASTICAGDCNGSATVTASGGTGLITYQLNSPVITNTTGIFTGLCAGAYIVQITDANGCSTSQVFNISAPPLLTAAITGVMNTCNICTGAATVTVNGGVPGYTVNWTNSVSATVATGTTASNLCLGNYTVTVTDANGCVRAVTVGIANTVSVTVVTSGSSLLCFAACNATATANPSGGTAPYTFTWNSAPTQTTQTATGLCAGNYTVTVVDNIGCSNTGTIAFTQPSSITVTSSQTNIPCFGGCVGAITNTVSGGTSPYTFSWSPGGQTTSSLTSLCTGTYSIKVTDLNGCTLTPATFTIASNPSLTIVFTSTTPSGCNVTNGVISATASGGTGAGYQFTWSPASASVVAGPVTTATGLGAGTYTLFVQDGAGCTNSFVTSLSNPAGPTVNVTSSSITCFGGANGSATATAVGTGPFTFTWNPATASVVVGATTTASGMTTGTYNINVTDIATGCITSQTVNILQPTQMTLTTNVTNATCSNTPNGSITAVVSGGTPNYTLNWLPAGTGTAITNLGPGNYTVNANDANGCIISQTFVVTAPSGLTVTSTQTNVSCNSGSNAAISLTVSGGTPGYTFTWTPVGPFPGSAASSVNGLVVNVYTVNIADNNGCPTVATFTITEPTAIGHTVTTTNAVCNSSCTGTASQVVTGGTPTYSFSWSSLAATTQSVGSLCAGNYTATITDGNGCISTRTFVITQPAAISITATPTSPKCNAACDGSITTNVTGGNPGYSYSWLPTGVGPNPTGLCAGTYTLSLTDASLCPGVAVITLTNPPLITSNITFTNPLCNTNCNGVALSTPANAVPAVQFTWTTVPPQTAATATGLCAGTYSVFILDANGCTDTGVVIITNPPVLNVNVSIAAATCGSANAQVTVTPAGGTPAYNFTWTPAVAGNTNVAQNISAGIYTISVTDNNGCNNTQAFPVSNSGGATLAAISITSVNCNNQCTGGATITSASGGTSPYVFSWVAPPSANTLNPQSNLCAGTYTAVITDSNNCVYFQGITIDEPTAIDDNEAITSAFCIGVCSGSITLTTTGGTGPYTYAWSPSASTSSVATNLCVGVHTATITDALGCTFTANYNVNGTTILTSAIATTSNLCFGNCNGSATVTATGGGLAPFSYSWSNAQNGLIANNLCNGTYSLIVTDNNGCQNTFTTDIVSPNAISTIPSIVQPSCGLCNGSASVNASGGSAPYTYSWTSSSTTSVETNMCAGLYQVVITDTNGCTSTQNIPISSSTSMTEVYNVQDELCAGSCNGQVTVTPSGGTAPYAFNWLTPPSTNSILTNVCGGTYFVQITDAQGCVITSSVSVNSATTIAVNPNVIQPLCGSNQGTITVSPTGGSGSYTVSWLPAGSGTMITGSAGIYTVSVFDGNCTQTTAINMNNSTAPAVFFTVTNNGCSSGACIGSIVATPTLGTPQYDFVWSNGGSALSVPIHSVTGLCAGVITLTVTDAAGCMAFHSFTITEDPLLNLSLPTVTQVKCFGDCNGSIQLVPSGGTLPYVISWIPASTVTPSNPNINLCAGTYTGVVTDANGCVLTRTVDIIEPSPYTYSAQVTDATCNSSSDGAISTTVTGATPGYTYTWTDALSNTYTTSSLTNLLPGTYTLSIVDSQGCLKNDTLTVNGSFTVLANAGADMTLCITPDPITLDGSASINGQTYNWTQLAPTNTIANTVSTSVIPAVGTNTYVLLATSSVVTCFDEDTVLVVVNDLPNVNPGVTQTVSLYATAILGGNPTSINTGASYTWTPALGLDNPNAANPITSTTVNTNYTVMVLDPNTGCINSSTVDIFIYPDVIIPNGFSPNSDGRNDTWIIDNIQQFTECTVEVYNRWGELLFQSPKGYPKPWDGIYHGKPLPVGTYYYIINFNHVAYPKPFTGPLTIFR